MLEHKGFVFSEDQTEQEKYEFGGDIYKYSYKLPTLRINSENIETFKNYTSMLCEIFNTFGPEVTLLFAELYNIYNIGDENLEDISPHKKSIIGLCTVAIGQISLALEQAKLLSQELEKSIPNDRDLEIEGNQYCFIIIILNSLFLIYSSIFNYMMGKQYINDSFVERVQARIGFIISKEFDSIRRLFKVIEGHNDVFREHTFH